MRFSLKQLLLVVLGLSAVFAVVGGLANQTAIVRVLFNTADKEVGLESRSVEPRGTFFELRQGSRTLISKRPISLRPLRLSHFHKYEFAPDEELVAYFAQDEDPGKLDVLLLVDLKSNAYSVYWGGCRADKCNTLDWSVWDQRQIDFLKFHEGATKPEIQTRSGSE